MVRLYVKIDFQQPVQIFLKQLAKTPSGFLLLSFAGVFLLLAVIPEIAVYFFGARSYLADTFSARGIFLLMPFVLFAQYVWFALAARGVCGEILLSTVLIVISLIPFVRFF